MIEKTVDNSNRIISIELAVPAKDFNTMEFAERFHNHFVGNPDYVESNIVVHDDAHKHAGTSIFIKDVKDFDRMRKELTNAFNDVMNHIELKK